MTKDDTGRSRRDVLKLAGLSVPAAVAAAAVGGAEEARADDGPDAGEGLRMTPHVKKALATARF